MDNTNKNITELSNGLYTDCSPIKQPKGTQRFSLNALKESHGIVGNENSNQQLDTTKVPLIVGDVILGKVYISDNLFALFIISYKDKDGKDLTTPVSKICLFDTKTEILYIEVEDSNSTDKLNFKAENQIQATYRLRRGCEKTIYFVQKGNVPRYYNFDKPYDFKDESNTFVASKFSLIKTFKKYPIFERKDNKGNTRFGLKVVNNGKLIPGSKNVCFRYVDEDFNTTEWITTTEPVVIYHKDYNNFRKVRGTTSSKKIYQDFGETDKALEVSIKASSLDFNYPYFQLGLIEANGATGKVSRVVTSPEIPIQISHNGVNDYYTFTFTGASSYGESSEKEVLVNSNIIESGKTITQVDNKLLIGNTEGVQIDWCKLQKYVSKIETRVALKEIEMDENNNPSQPETITDCMSFMPGEIHSIGLVWDFEGGFTSPVYHIPGVSSSNGKALYKNTATYYGDTLPFDINNTCNDITYSNNYNCDTDDSYWNKDAIGNDLEEEKVRHHRFPLRSTYNKKPISCEVKEDSGNNNLTSYTVGNSHRILLWIRSKYRKVNKVYKKHFNDFTVDIKIEVTDSYNKVDEHIISRTISIAEWEESRKNNIKINNIRGGWFSIDLGTYNALDKNIKLIYISEKPQLFERSSGDAGSRYGWATSGGWIKVYYYYWNFEWVPDNKNEIYPSEFGGQNLDKYFNTPVMPPLGNPATQGYIYWDTKQEEDTYSCSVVNILGVQDGIGQTGLVASLLNVVSGGIFSTVTTWINCLAYCKKRKYEVLIQQNDDIDITGQEDVFTETLFGIKLFGIEVPSLEDTNGHKIVGYHLVANKRDEENKTILDSAVTFPMFQNRNNNPTYSAYCFNHPIITNSTPVFDKNHIAFFNPDFKFLKKQYKNFTFIPEYNINPRFKTIDRYYDTKTNPSGAFSILRNNTFISNTNTFKPDVTQSSQKTCWILEDVQGGTTYDPKLDSKKEEDNDGFQLYNLVREIPVNFDTTIGVNSQLNSLKEFTPQSVEYLSPLESFESKYDDNGNTKYTSVYNLSSDNNIGIMTLTEEDSEDNTYLRGFMYGYLKRDISNPYGLFRLLPYYNISKNIEPVVYDEDTSLYNYNTTYENFGGDIFISPIKYTNSMFYDIRNRRRKRKQGIWQIIGGSLAAVAATVAFIIISIVSYGAGTALTTVYITAMSAAVGLIINGARIQHANSVYTQLYQLGLKDCIDDDWTKNYLKNPNPEDDQVQWVHETINSLWFESNINLFWRVDTNGNVNSFLDPLGHYSLDEYYKYFQNKVTILDTEHKDGRLYIGFCKAEYYEANLDYLRRNEQKIFYHLPIEYDCCSKCLEKFPHRVVYSESSFQEEKTDNYRKFLPNNYKEIEGDTGEITNIFQYNDRLYLHTKEAFYVIPRSVQEKTIGQIVAFVGTGEFLSLPANKIIDDSTGLSAGSQHQWCTLITRMGVLFVDEHSRTIYLYNQEGLKPISSIGEEKWFNKNIPILQNEDYLNIYQEEYPYQDNPSSDFGNGYISTYDKENERFIITKKDLKYDIEIVEGDVIDGYFLYNNRLYPKHTVDSKFIIDNTPDGYTFSHIDENTAQAIYIKTTESSIKYYTNDITPYTPPEEYVEVDYNIIWKYNNQIVNAAYILENYNISIPSTLTLSYKYDNIEDEIVINSFPYTTISIDYISDQNPINPFEGMIYYNNYSKKIFTYSSSAWDAGVTPVTNIYYFNKDDELSYQYDGSTLVLSRGFSYPLSDLCIPINSEIVLNDITSIFEDTLNDNLSSLDINSTFEGEECPYKQVINIVVELGEVDTVSPSICKEWYNYITEGEDEQGNPITLEDPYYELITDEEELATIAENYDVTIYVYKNKLLYETITLPIVTYDNCNNQQLSWCTQLDFIKETDIIDIYEEIINKDTQEIEYGWFQQITKEDGNYIIANKPKHCTESGGGTGNTDDYFNVIINKCFECENGNCLPEIDATTFDITFVQKDLITSAILHSYKLNSSLSTLGKIVVPLTCSEILEGNELCCLKKCGSGAYPYTETEINNWGVEYPEDPYTWDLVKAAFNDIATGGTNGWEILIEDKTSLDCEMTITQSYEPLSQTESPSLLYTIENICDCCTVRCIDVVKLGLSWSEEVLDVDKHNLSVYINNNGNDEEIFDIDEETYPLRNKGTDSGLSDSFLGAYSSPDYPTHRWFFKAMTWQNIHIACDIYDILYNAYENNNPCGSVVSVTNDIVYKSWKADNSGGYNPLLYDHCYLDINSEGKLTIYILNTCIDSNILVPPNSSPLASEIAEFFDDEAEGFNFIESDCEEDVQGIVTFALGGLIEGECTCVDEIPYSITETEETSTTETISTETVDLVPLKVNLLNNSWTKSFDIKEKIWISYHSYLPNFYLHNNETFYSFKNDIEGLWKHNIIGEFQTFYEVTYPFILDYVSLSSPIVTRMWEYLQFIVDSQVFDSSSEDYIDIDSEFFDKIILYNSKQCSGELDVKIKKNIIDSDYFITQLNENNKGEIVVDRIERNWFINNLRDRRVDYSKPIFKKDLVSLQDKYFIDKIIDLTTIDLDKSWLELENFRDKYLQIRLIFSNFASETNTAKNVKLLMNFIIEEEKISNS